MVMELQSAKPGFDAGSSARDGALRDEAHMSRADQEVFSLVDLIKRHQVCWEVWPEYLLVGGAERQVGFELELSGTPEPGTDHVGPGCPACRRVYAALHAVAEWILPKEERPSMYDIGPYEQALRYSLVRGSRPDVTLSVKILHRRGFDQPVDRCESSCLEEMKQRLRQLGACERQWSSRSVAHILMNKRLNPIGQ